MNELTATPDTMTSRDFAEMSGKPHNDVLKKIRKLESAYVQVFGSEGNFSLVKYTDAKGEERPEIRLNKSQALFVASRFDAVLHARVQKRWEDLESDSKKLMVPQDLPTALRMYANEVEQKQLAITQRDEAVRTKAEIGTRREASAMGTASAEKRRANKLEDEIGRGKNWKETRTIAWVKTYFAISRGMWSVLGRQLTKLSTDIDCTVEKVESSRYGLVNAYHVDVIEKFRCKLEADENLMIKYRICED